MKRRYASSDRHHTRIGWLDSRHTFNFGHHWHPGRNGFGPLLVINDDRVTPGAGFGAHGHRDMEILSYVVEGALEHRDSMGHGSVIRPGDVQRMSAGTGVRHSEFNASEHEGLRFLQIWIVPDRAGHAPGYEQKRFEPAARRGRLVLLASPDGAEGSITIHQDARLYGATLPAGAALEHAIAEGRRAFVQVVRGRVAVDGEALGEGDGLALAEVGAVTLEGLDEAELLVFDLP